MNKIFLTGLVFLVSCASGPTTKEKEWIDDFVDSGVFNQRAIMDGKLLYLGSENKEYSNISSDKVSFIDDQLLKIVLAKYGTDSIVEKKNELDSEPRFRLSYDIRDNKVTKSNDKKDTKECYNVSRHIKVELKAVDSISSEKVWGGVVDKYLSDNNCNPRSKPDNNNFLASFIEAVIGGVVESTLESLVFGTYPEAPQVTSVTKIVFEAFGENLP
jgi:hypothetical protein